MTRTGTLLRGIMLPLPSWPSALNPQAQTVPSDFTARLWALPAATATAPPRPLTVTSTLLSALLLLPSWPTLLRPQARTVPPGESAAHRGTARAATQNNRFQDRFRCDVVLKLNRVMLFSPDCTIWHLTNLGPRVNSPP